MPCWPPSCCTTLLRQSSVAYSDSPHAHSTTLWAWRHHSPAGGSADGGLLRGRRALVVGGTRGIGRGIALALAANAASVTIVGRGPGDAVVRAMAARAEATAATSNPPAFRSHAFDLSTVGGCSALVANLARTEGDDGGYDYVFFTVGVWPNFSDPFTTDGVS